MSQAARHRHERLRRWALRVARQFAVQLLTAGVEILHVRAVNIGVHGILNRHAAVRFVIHEVALLRPVSVGVPRRRIANTASLAMLPFALQRRRLPVAFHHYQLQDSQVGFADGAQLLGVAVLSLQKVALVIVGILNRDEVALSVEPDRPRGVIGSGNNLIIIHKRAKVLI